MNRLYSASFALLIGGIFVASGCASDCKKLGDKLTECSEKKPTDKQLAEFTESCEKNASNDDVKTELECMNEHDSCDAFEKCVSTAKEAAWKKKELDELKADPESDSAKFTCSRMLKEDPSDEVKTVCAGVIKKAAAKKIGEIKAKVAKEKGDAGLSDCEWALKDDDIGEDAELAKYCKALPAEILKSLTTTAEKMRDGGKYDHSSCYDLKKVAEAVGAETATAAEVLCKEAEAAGKVKDAVKKTTEEAKTDKPKLPYNCQSTIKELQKVDTEWSKKQIPVVAKACYATLGAIILEKRKDEKWCSSVADTPIVAAFDKFKFGDQKLKGLVEAVKNGRCKGK
ncbi:MAG: hypothetical protein ACI9OJ_003938 [Myxococcota bacterium]|jgi:hypothetical protein